jgi:curved DNA-binding protein
MGIEFKDYYRILGVPRDASAETIRRAFRKLAREYHPDVAKNKSQAEEKFKEINEAYEVLGDPEKRRKYDTLGANWNASGGFQPPPGGRRRSGTRPGSEGFEFSFGGTGFSDFFDQFFGRQGRGFAGFGTMDEESGFGQKRHRAQRGEDLEGDILVTLTEVLKGSVRSVSLERRDPQTGQASTQQFRVRLPAGVKEGQIIRVAGQGDYGVAGGAAGDLLLRVRLAKHPDFRVEGSDLYGDLELAPWEAVLGATLSLPTLEGSVTLRIPPGTQQGQAFRIRNRGLPSGGNRRGDLYAVATIHVPTQPGEEERALWEKLAKTARFNPRSAS